MTTPTTSPPNDDNEDDDDDDKNNTTTVNIVDSWAATADLYDQHAARLTERHGHDLVGLLQADIRTATTILEIGCGSGAFAQAYLQYFPHGIPGQTLILSDLSLAMLDKARAKLSHLLLRPDNGPAGEDNGFATKIVIQQEDGTQLAGIDDHSIDIVVSLFGVFLIPDQAAVFRSIQRVLRRPPSSTTTAAAAVFANASWVFDVSDDLLAHGLGGPSLQDVFATPTRSIDPTRLLTNTMPSIHYWSDRTEIAATLGKQLFRTKDDNDDTTSTAVAVTTVVHQASHTSVWQWPFLWQMLVQNPMSIIKEASPEDVARAKQATMEFLLRRATKQKQQQDGLDATTTTTTTTFLDDDDNEPMILSSISNLTICRCRWSSP